MIFITYVLIIKENDQYEKLYFKVKLQYKYLIKLFSNLSFLFDFFKKSIIFYKIVGFLTLFLNMYF